MSKVSIDAESIEISTDYFGNPEIDENSDNAMIIDYEY